MSPSSPAQAIAHRAADAMYSRDTAAKALGIGLESVGPGEAVMVMDVRGDMVNGHDICHGGMIFSLADTCFAYACNSYDAVTVARQCQISFLTPARRGDTLTATGRERHRKGKSGIYDISVANQNGEEVAVFRGWSHTIGGSVTE